MQSFFSNHPYKIGIGVIFIFTFVLSLYYLFPEVADSNLVFFGDGWEGFATGADGYYYAYQVREFLVRGYFPAPEVSPVLYFMAFLASMTGNVVASNKIAAVVIKAAFVFPAWSIGRNLFSPKAGFVFALLLVSSSFINYFTYQYIKNSGALFLFLCFLAFFIKFLKNGEFKNKFNKDNVALVIFFVLALLSHKTTAFFCLMTIGIYLVYKYVNKMYIIMGGAVALVGAVGMAGFFLPNLIYLGDFLRFEGYFKGSFSCVPCEYISRVESIHKVETFLLAMAPAVMLFNFMYKKYKKKYISAKEKNILSVIMGLIFIISINPLGGSIDNDMAYRLFILIFIPGAFFLTFVFDSGFGILHDASERVGKVVSKNFRKVARMFSWIALSAFVLSNQIVSAKRFNTSKLHDYKLYSQLIPFIDDLPQNSLLIVHQGFDYYYWYRTGKKAFHFMPEKKHEDRPLYRLVWGIPRNGFRRVIENSGHTKQLDSVKYLPGNYIFLKEETWGIYLDFIGPEEQMKVANWRNPHTYRKEYLLRNQQFRLKKSSTKN